MFGDKPYTTSSRVPSRALAKGDPIDPAREGARLLLSIRARSIWTRHHFQPLGVALSERTVRARLELIVPDAGGRVGPIDPGYRSLARFENSDLDFGVEIGFGRECLAPGESAEVRLRFWAAEELPELHVGAQFAVREGARLVGIGEILETPAEA